MNLLKNFNAEAIIFDKDGTLIDFDAMWGGWTLQLADRLQEATGLDMHDKLCATYGYDKQSQKIIRDSIMTYTPMWKLREIMTEMVISLGASPVEAESAVEKAWVVPNPITLAKPFTDLHLLFESIHKKGIKIAIATTDDHEPTEALLAAFDIKSFVSTMICADDGIPAKPAPDMITTICERINVHPSKTIVVGDTVADMKMGCAAGAGMVVGVLSGVGSIENLTPLASILLDSIDTLQVSFAVDEESQPLEDLDDGLTNLNPDLAF